MAAQAENLDNEVFFHGAEGGLSVRVRGGSAEREYFEVSFDPPLSQEQIEKLRATAMEAQFSAEPQEDESTEYEHAVMEGPDARHYAFAEMGWNGKSQTVGSMMVKVALGRKIYETLSKED
jgi:hypothetical protein